VAPRRVSCGSIFRLMRIIHYMLGIRLREGGVARASIDICSALAKRGHDVTMLTNDASDAPADWDGSPGRPRCEIVERNRLQLLTAKSAARARELFSNAEIVHLHVPWDPICWQLGRIACRLDKPYFITTHGMLDDWSMAQTPMKKKLYLTLFARGLLERAAAVQSTARAEQDQSTKWYSRGTSIMIPYLFDLGNYRTLPGAALAKARFPHAFDSRPTVLFLSRLHVKKNAEALIHAAEFLRDGAEAFKVLIAGSGEPEYERRLRALTERRRLSDCVEFLGFVSGDLKTSLYQAADIFALPTHQENFGIVLVEALVCGTPVITTRGVDIWPELQSSGGVLIANGDPQSLADGIRMLLRDESRRREMAERGRAWVYRYLEPQRVIRMYEEIYKEAIEQRT
jgi:glycosyltransferase involved in cell wall biosynthesis